MTRNIWCMLNNKSIKKIFHWRKLNSNNKLFFSLFLTRHRLFSSVFTTKLFQGYIIINFIFTIQYTNIKAPNNSDNVNSKIGLNNVLHWKLWDKIYTYIIIINNLDIYYISVILFTFINREKDLSVYWIYKL